MITLDQIYAVTGVFLLIFTAMTLTDKKLSGINKVATAVKLFFDLSASTLSPEEQERFRRAAGQRISSAGVLVLHARRFRTQEANRRDALERLAELLRWATTPPVPRVPTRPGRSVQLRRRKAREHLQALKQARRRKPEEE